MALTDIGVVAFVIKVDAQDVDAVFHAFRRVELHHVFVAQVIARGQNDAGRGDLEVAVVADDAAAVGAGTAAHVVDHRGVPLLLSLIHI